MANNTSPKFDKLVNTLRGMSSSAVKATSHALVIETLVCVEQFRTAHALNQAAEVLEIVTGGKNLIKYLKYVSPFTWTKADGFCGKMKNKKFSADGCLTIQEWMEEQKQKNQKTDFQKLMQIINNDNFKISKEECLKVLESLNQYA